MRRPTRKWNRREFPASTAWIFCHRVICGMQCDLQFMEMQRDSVVTKQQPRQLMWSYFNVTDCGTADGERQTQFVAIWSRWWAMEVENVNELDNEARMHTSQAIRDKDVHRSLKSFFASSTEIPGIERLSFPWWWLGDASLHERLNSNKIEVAVDVVGWRSLSQYHKCKFSANGFIPAPIYRFNPEYFA